MKLVWSITTFGLFGVASASQLVDAAPLTDRIILLHYKDGYVVHHKRGEARSNETVVQDPLDVAQAVIPATYQLTSATDPAYRQATKPLAVGRKSKGTDFAWFTDRWVGDHFENDRPDHTKEHWLYLEFPKPLTAGKDYVLNIGGNPKKVAFRFDVNQNRSEAVHVNLIGYAPAAPAKFGYVYQWMGDRGGLSVMPYIGRPFRLIEAKTGKAVFAGRTRFRKDARNAETAHLDTPYGNFLLADVLECDFSTFTRSGTYYLSVDGFGRSLPFRVDPDVYRVPFRTTARGLYHNRSGIALKRPYTTFERPAPHHPGVTPGFTLKYSSLRFLDYGSESGTREMIEPTIKGPLEAWGWYQDAGDWDAYPTHLRVAQELLLAYELNPSAFRDGELNIPESGNGIPDILDEAAWLPRFGYRLRHELLTKHYGTGGLGLRISGDVFGGDTKPGDVGQGSWEDTRLWVASGEDPVSTYRYAGTCAQLAYVLKQANLSDPDRIDWRKEAQEAYAWAQKNTLVKDEAEVKIHRLYAAAALFRLTGSQHYEAQVRTDFDPGQDVWFENLYGPAIYARTPNANPELCAQVTEAILRTARNSADSADKRALRWGGNWYFPMLVGQQTTPWVMELAVGRHVATNPAEKARFSAALYTTCDYFLGTNALNTTWVTGLGPRHPIHPFHMDAWYNGQPTVHPGIVPYGQWRVERPYGAGPWDHDWPNKTVYPSIYDWPGNERFFDNRCSPMASEFTIHQTTAPTAAIFGILCAPQPSAAKRKTTVRRNLPRRTGATPQRT